MARSPKPCRDPRGAHSRDLVADSGLASSPGSLGHVTVDLGMPTKGVRLAAPRGYCAGVDRAVITVEKALDLYGDPVYVRKQIVHNKHVVADLESRGAVFVE